jgi:hypothetical protein
VFEGEFSLTFAETDHVKYFHMMTPQGLTWSPEPYIFNGTISSSLDGTQGPLWALEDTYKARSLVEIDPTPMPIRRSSGWFGGMFALILFYDLILYVFVRTTYLGEVDNEMFILLYWGTILCICTVLCFRSKGKPIQAISLA